MERITKDYVEDMGIFEYKGNQEEGSNDLTTYNDEPEINETGNQPEENSPAFNNHAHEIVNRHENNEEQRNIEMEPEVVVFRDGNIDNDNAVFDVMATQ